MRGLRKVRNDAQAMLEERQGHGETSASDADQERALDWLEALIAWHEDKAGSEPADPVASAAPRAPAADQNHHPDCLSPNGHNGPCVLTSEFADVDPRTGTLLSKGALQAARTRIERTKKGS